MNDIRIKQVMKEEYIKCATDPLYFIKKYCYIQHPQRGRILFHLYNFQEKVLKRIIENDYTIINKSRQLGISTLVAGYALWLMLFFKDKNILCIATKQETAKNMVTKVKFMYENLPSWLSIKYEESNKLNLKLINGSQIKAASAASDTGRSESVSYLIIDEAAFIEGIGQIWASAQQTLATGGGCTVISTPNGTGNWFHNTAIKAKTKDINNKFYYIELPWFVHPERDQKWRDEQDFKLGDKRMAAQECFSGDVIVYTKKGPKFIKDIIVGEEVLSHDGTFNKVNKIFSQIKNKNLFELKSGLNNISKIITGNHPFLNEENKWKEIKNIIPKKEYINIFPNNIKVSEKENVIDLLNYIEAENPKYFPLKNNNEYIWLNKKSNINRFIKWDYDLGFLLGIYLAEGSYWKNVVAFTYNRETDKFQFNLEKIISDKFNINIFSHYTQKASKANNLYIKNQIFKKFIELCVSGKYSYEKQLSSFVYENINKEVAKGIIDGILEGDGMLKNEYNCSLGLTSEFLIYDILYLSNLLGRHNITLKKIEERKQILFNKEFLCKNYFTLTFLDTKINSNKKTFSKRITEKNTNSYKKSKFKFKDKPLTTLNHQPLEDKEIIVFNLEVENTHTYVTEYGVVHNCDCDFASSGHTFFPSDYIGFYEKTYIKDPIVIRGGDKGLWVWYDVDFSKSYTIIADVARGDGEDFSTAQVLDIENNIQVAEYKGQLSTREFGKFLVGLAQEYNGALLVVENSNIGWDTINTIIETGYRNFYYSTKNETVDAESYFDKFENSQNLVPGFSMTLKVRPLLLNKFREYLTDKSVVFHSKRLLEEMKVFIWKNGKPQAQNGYNDDLIISFAIGMYLRETSFKFKHQSEDLSRITLQNISVNRSSTYTGVYTPNNFRANPYKWEVKGNQEDLSWLFNKNK